MDSDLTDAFKALGNPHRLAIMKQLLADVLSCSEADRPEECELDPTCCGFAALADDLDIGKATVSHHLKELRRANLVERIKDGRRVYVRANTDRIEELRRFLDAQLHADTD
jgi:ArsR family transcriptional regulator